MPNLRFLPLVAAVLLAATTAAAQQPAPAGKPYRAVAVSPPTEIKDADLAAVRARIAEASKNRDRSGLTKLVATKGFFWDRDGSDAAKGRPGIDVISGALGLSNKEGVGWDMLGGFAEEPNAAPSPTRKSAVCAPAEPRYDTKAFAALLKQTQTDAAAWGYSASPGLEVRATPQPSAPVVEKLGAVFVRVLPEPSANPKYVRVLTPAGKSGFVIIDALADIGSDQLCYIKEGGAWKIGGYIGTGEP